MKCAKCSYENPEGSLYCSECGTKLIPAGDMSKPNEAFRPPPLELTTGSTFADRYQIIEELGKGGMGKVYKAVDTKINDKIALKLIKPDISSDRKTIERFKNEIRTARKIRHRNICRMYDLGEEQGTHFITMEFVPGEDLRSMIKMSGRLAVGTTINIAIQVCEGLAEAHSLGVVHRDLKPGNIMIDRQGNVRIMDFGIARSREVKGITAAGMMIGTPEYMSPEQVEGKDVDHRSDIYSLGIILFEMVTGRVPFEGESSLRIAIKHKTEAPPDPRKFNSRVPIDLSLAILKCLEKDPKKRFQNAEEVLAELNRIEEHISGVERIPSQARLITPKVKRGLSKKVWIVTAASVVTLAIIVLGILFFPSLKPKIPGGKNMLVVLPFENLGPSADQYFADGITEEITSRLAAIHMLGVISRTSAVQYEDTNKTTKQIGEELGVDYILEGSVRWDRDLEGQGRVRVTSQLVRVTDDTNLWSERYDRIIEDIFSVQSDIAEQVARKLDLTILEPERRALTARPTENLEAYDLYLRGREHGDRGWAYLDETEFDTAIELFERATVLDPDFALPYLRMCYIHSRMYFFGVDRTRGRLTRARTAVNRALELQPNDPEAQRILGFFHYWCLADYDRAAEIFEAVQKARPNYDPQLLGYIQRRQGKWGECVETLERAFRINPRDTQIIYELGGANISLHRFEEAEKWFNIALSIYPGHLPAQLGKIGIHILSEGDTDKALNLWKTLPPHQLTDYMWFTLSMLANNYQEVLDWLASLPYDTYEDQHFYFKKDLAYTTVFYAMKNISQMKIHAERARLALEKAVSEQPEDPRYHAALGLVCAYLDRGQDAVREGNLAKELHPMTKDAAQGPIYLLNLAMIYTVIGETEKAIDQLEYLLSIPQAEFLWQLISVPQLQLDPQWDSLREHPRFMRLVGEE